MRLTYELFRGLHLLYFKIKIFIPVNAQMGWLDNVSGVPQAHFSLLLIGQQGFNIFSGTGPCFPLAGRF
jgi:hypothetical protein